MASTLGGAVAALRSRTVRVEAPSDVEREYDGRTAHRDARGQPRKERRPRIHRQVPISSRSTPPESTNAILARKSAKIIGNFVVTF